MFASCEIEEKKMEKIEEFHVEKITHSINVFSSAVSMVLLSVTMIVFFSFSYSSDDFWTIIEIEMSIS